MWVSGDDKKSNVDTSGGCEVVFGGKTLFEYGSLTVKLMTKKEE